MNDKQSQPDQVQPRDTSPSVDSLVSALSSPDATTRLRAIRALVEVGERAVSSLVEALQHGRDQMRWEAARALKGIASPQAAPALVAALRDEESRTRWLAAEALIALGSDGLEPLLQGLIQSEGSTYLWEGAHHVLHEQVPGPYADLVQPMLAALEGGAPESCAPVAASVALQALRQRASSESDATHDSTAHEAEKPRRQVG